MRTAAAVLTVLIGALLFGYFLTVTQTPQKVTALLTGLGLGRYGVLALIMLMYIVLGCLMDALAMIILTIPIIFPVITQLGFDPIWFGVIIVMTVELGLIHPPVGMNVFVIKSVVQDVSVFDDFQGRAAVHRHRSHPPGDLDIVPDAGALFAVAHVAVNSQRTGRFAMLRLLLAAALIALTLPPSGHYVADTAQKEENNKKVVAEFYEAAINRKNFEAAAKFLGPRYIQHNPNAVDGPEGLKAFINFLREISRTHAAR